MFRDRPLGPDAGLFLDRKSDFYGTTGGGGASGYGTAFKLHVNPHTYTILHSFTGTEGDGSSPAGALISDNAGNLYGTTVQGGIYDTTCGSFPYGCGIVFKLDSTGKETMLYSFAGGTDGANPYGALIQDSAGNLYGTTGFGGGGQCQNSPYTGCGTVFKLDKAGKETVLYSFAGGTDGAYPLAGLVRDEAGNLYGTTSAGGGTGGCVPVQGCGTVFELDATGTETILYRFSGGTDGANPYASLLRDANGNLYGTTYAGGGGDKKMCVSRGCGVVFKITP